MGEVILFRKRAIQTPRKKPSNGKYWRVVDFLDGPPREHKPAKRGPRGRPLVARGQVWVEGGTGKLIVVTRVRPHMTDTFYHCFVEYRLYGKKRGLTDGAAELPFRQHYEVWEDHLISHAQLMEKFGRLSQEDEGSPWKGQGEAAVVAAQSFFGLDEHGYRTDD